MTADDWYPKVRDEWETIKVVGKGKSLARLGDGELSHLYSREGGRQSYHPNLTLEMRILVCDPHPNCLVGIPTMDPKGPKFAPEGLNGRNGWHRHRARFAAKLSPKVRYYSAFVTRPDSAPSIESREFCEKFQSVWAGKRVAVVGHADGITLPDGRTVTNKVLTVARWAAKEVVHIVCPLRNAYAEIDRLEEKVVASQPEVVLLSCGPTASVLANRLSWKGLQAIDIGSAGAFLARNLEVEEGE